MGKIIKFPVQPKQTSPVRQPTQATKPTQATNKVILWPIAGTLCLMLMMVPFANQYYMQSQTNRSIASTKESEKSNDSQNRAILHLLQTGQRKIASVGKAPGIKEDFLTNLLQSRYEVKWQENNQLEYFIVMENQQPLKLPPLPQLVKSYPKLFPKHSQMIKASHFSKEVEAYDLYDNQNLHIGLVEAIRDEKDRVLSVYAQ